MTDRNDDTAAAEESMYRNALNTQGDKMDAATRAKFLANLVSARGQLDSAQKRAEAESRQGNGNTGRGE